jgi:hypothetical protein
LAQAEIVPSSVAKMKEAGRFVPGTRNAVAGLVVGFQITPVGLRGDLARLRSEGRWRYTRPGFAECLGCGVHTGRQSLLDR